MECFECSSTVLEDQRPYYDDKPRLIVWTVQYSTLVIPPLHVTSTISFSYSFHPFPISSRLDILRDDSGGVCLEGKEKTSPSHEEGWFTRLLDSRTSRLHSCITVMIFSTLRFVGEHFKATHQFGIETLGLTEDWPSVHCNPTTDYRKSLRTTAWHLKVQRWVLLNL